MKNLESVDKFHAILNMQKNSKNNLPFFHEKSLKFHFFQDFSKKMIIFKDFSYIFNLPSLHQADIFYAKNW